MTTNKLAEEILMKICGDEYDYSLVINSQMDHINSHRAIEAMQKYANLYYKEKIKEECTKCIYREHYYNSNNSFND